MCRALFEGAGSLRVSWSGSEAEWTFIVGAINVDVAKASAGGAHFMVEPMGSIH
jgi:hypothetical protein